eukprot:12401647-Karenia_brevis.AAC.1
MWGPASLLEGLLYELGMQQRKVRLKSVAVEPPGGIPWRYLLCMLSAVKRKDPFRSCTFQLRFTSVFC